MQRAVAFAKDIKSSQLIADTYPSLIATHQELLKDKAVLNDVSLTNVDLRVAAQHVDGGMNAMERGTKLSWIESPADENESRMLTNARCLSEGVDVPALDAVVFFNPRNSMVDVVQSVGRVMRKSAGRITVTSSCRWRCHRMFRLRKRLTIISASRWCGRFSTRCAPTMIVSTPR